jgi:hypothetical protein
VSADLERDLGAWARGELARERLLTTHGAEAAGSVALHERLTEMAAGIAVPAAVAGWSALSVQLGAPAPVVPLRRLRRRRRTLSILVAAALVVAGSAFAAVVGSMHHDAPAPRGTSAVSVPTPGASSVAGPTGHGQAPRPSSPRPIGAPHAGAGPSSDGGAGTSEGSAGRTGGPAATDDPRDRDHGTGNDGSHNDHGSGNNGPSGTLPRASHGH